jgi:hypothetical protein
MRTLPQKLPISFISRRGCSPQCLSIFCAPDGNPILLSAGIVNASHTGFVINGALFGDGEWSIFQSELRDDRLLGQRDFDTILSIFRGTTRDDEIVIATAKNLPYPTVFEGRRIRFDCRARTFNFEELFPTSAISSGTVCVTDGASVPSSRLGFWVEKEKAPERPAI